ncbi:MAG: hypothetical protein KGQ37_09815 [Hyphomicrobiales bacterium]|nr:hypothetical protein [Hyphomicrobiales bacterium]
MARKPLALRLVGAAVMLVLGLMVLGVLVFAALVLRVEQGPVDLSFAMPDIVNSINARLGQKLKVGIKSLVLEGGATGLHLTARGFDLSGPDGHLLSGAQAVLALDPWAMLRGQLVPSTVALSQLALIVTVNQQGSITMANGAAPPVKLAAPPVAPPAPAGAVTPAPDVAHEVGQVLDRLLAADTPLAALHKVLIRDSSITVRDLAHDSTAHLAHVDLSLARLKGGATLDLIASDGDLPWHARARVETRAADASRFVQLHVDHWSFAALRHLVGLPYDGTRLDVSGTMDMTARLSRDGALMSLAAGIKGGHGLFKANNQDFEPFLFDGFSLKAHYDPARAVILIDTASLKSGKSALSLVGQITPPLTGTGKIGYDLTIDKGTQLGASRPGDSILQISSGHMAGFFDQAKDQLTLDQFQLQGPQVHIAASASAVLGAAPHVTGQASITAMQARDVIRLWPSSLAAPVRAWFRQRLTGGIVDDVKIIINLDAKALAQAAAQQAVPDAALNITGVVKDIGLKILDGFPEVTDINASGVLTGHTVRIAINAGKLTAQPGKTLTISAGSFTMRDSSLMPAPATILATMSGSLATTTQLLGKDALRPFVHLPLDPKSIAGTIKGQLQVSTLLGDHVPPSATKVGVVAKITDFSASNLIGKAGITHGVLDFKVGPQGMKGSGTGTIFASPAKIELTQPNHGKGQGKLNFTLNDAARANLHIAVAGVSGPIGVAVVSPLGDAAPPKDKDKKAAPAPAPQQAQVTLDLGATTLDSPFPGLLKAPGRPARASFTAMVEPHATLLKNLNFDGGGVSFAGSATLGADGHLQSAQLTSVKLSALDQLQAAVTFGTDITKVVATGATFDMRSVWHSLTGQDKLSKAAPAGKPANVDISLNANNVVGYNDATLHNGRFRMLRIGGNLQAFQMGGTLGRGHVQGELSASKTIHITSSDAGATLSFLNLYNHMRGGALDLDASLKGSDASGAATIHNFVLADEPRLQQIAGAGNPRQSSAVKQLSSVPFQKLQAQFTSHSGAISIANAVMFGPDVGISMNGILNFPKNSLDVKGTFVPAYGINNIFSRIPLFGRLLGGGRHEGLFAVNYRISGPMGSPSLTFNPLSAIAPGFLRQIFGTNPPPAGFQVQH